MKLYTGPVLCTIDHKVKIIYELINSEK